MTKININNVEAEMHVEYNGEKYEYVEDLRDALLSGHANLCLHIGGWARIKLRDMLDLGNITDDCYRYTINDYLAQVYGFYSFGGSQDKTPITRR